MSVSSDTTPVNANRRPVHTRVDFACTKRLLGQTGVSYIAVSGWLPDQSCPQ